MRLPCGVAGYRHRVTVDHEAPQPVYQQIAAILRAQGERESQMLRAEGQAKAIETVFASIHAADPDPKLLAYQYLQVLPQIAQGESNKVWIIPSEVTRALGQLGDALPGSSDTTLPSTSRLTSPCTSVSKPGIGLIVRAHAPPESTAVPSPSLREHETNRSRSPSFRA